MNSKGKKIDNVYDVVSVCRFLKAFCIHMNILKGCPVTKIVSISYIKIC